MTRVIHTGDTHIGYQQYNSPDRRRDFLAAFDQVATDAIEADVDAVVHAGDLFHDRRPGLVDLQGTIRVLRRLADADIPFLAIVGNHETKRDAQWLDLFADLGLATRLGSEPMLVGDVALYGLDFVPKSRRDALSYDFAPPPSGAAHRALVGHGLFEPFAHATWETETVLSEASVDFDAMLLGDNHAPGTAEVADTWVTYCGSSERASASERDPRGYNLVTFDDEVTITRRGLDGTREFVFVDVELDEGEGVDRVLERLGQYELADAVVVVTIEGEGDPVSPAAVEEFAFERDALVARANDRREIADSEADLQVSFADPDTAVTKRLRELDLGTGALAIDATVRDETVADSNVREAVERSVRDGLTDDGLELAVDLDGPGPDPTDSHVTDDADGALDLSDEEQPDESNGSSDDSESGAEAGADSTSAGGTDDSSAAGDDAAATDDESVTPAGDEPAAEAAVESPTEDSPAGVDDVPDGEDGATVDDATDAADADSAGDPDESSDEATVADDTQVSIGDFS
ncbi:DNA double-strand break repair protein Mre11 [Halovivax limisalsi]|uniref:DNA double-strand break repair protein Mre11 n=1 Tax=Halovivax limisalsi TaxID=1453760 RepID=UPI001FFD985A|nr:DNA double-strand break repair protein Mre11 [Halovivax limisalsi]